METVMHAKIFVTCIEAKSSASKQVPALVLTASCVCMDDCLMSTLLTSEGCHTENKSNYCKEVTPLARMKGVQPSTGEKVHTVPHLQASASC
eukprot:3143110-Amphidinium_carterae.1